MARADDHAGRAQTFQRLRFHLFGRDGQHDLAAPRAAQFGQQVFIQMADQRWIVHALAHGIDERPFDMQADDARQALGNGGIDHVERCGNRRRRIGDQRGHQGRGAKARVRLGNRGQPFDGDIVVEQGPATAIDLAIDKARQQPAAVEINHGAINRHIGRNIRDAPGLDLHRSRRNDAITQQDMAVGKRQNGHRVRVTFARNGGSSGLKPRLIDSALTMR